MFFKIGLLKNFANFTRKHLCWSFFFIKLQAFYDFQWKSVHRLVKWVKNSDGVIHPFVHNPNIKETLIKNFSDHVAMLKTKLRRPVQVFNFSKSTIVTLEKGVILVSLLLTLNMFHTNF